MSPPNRWACAETASVQICAIVMPLLRRKFAALELEMKLSLYETALKRVDRLAAAAGRKETWLARRGEILEKLGRTDEARAAYEAALAALKSVPPARRQTEASLRLAETLNSAISRL